MSVTTLLGSTESLIPEVSGQPALPGWQASDSMRDLFTNNKVVGYKGRCC